MDSCQSLSRRVVRRPQSFVVHCIPVRVGADRKQVDCSPVLVDCNPVVHRAEEVGRSPGLEGWSGKHLLPDPPVHPPGKTLLLGG